MAEPARKRARVTPRNSEAQNELEQLNATTPFADLHQLGKIARPRSQQLEGVSRTTTPLQRALSAAAQRRIDVHTPSGHPSSPTNLTPRNGVLLNSNRVNTPATGTKATPNERFGNRVTPGRKPTTPHGKRAQQLNDRSRRYASATPGIERRKSGKMYRETPRDELRALSRVLAVNTAPIATSPASGSQVRSTRRSRSRQLEQNSPDPPPPRLSLARHEMDYDSFHEPAPRMSVDLDDDEVEEGRRQYQRRKSSFGVQRLDEQLNVLDELDEDSELGQVVDGLIENVLGDEEYDEDQSTMRLGVDNTTANLRAMLQNNDNTEFSFGRQSLGTDGEPTFQFNVPEATEIDWSRLSEQYAQHDDEAVRAAAQSFLDMEAGEDDDDVEESAIGNLGRRSLRALSGEDDEDLDLSVQPALAALASPQPVSSPDRMARAAASIIQRQTTRAARTKPTHISRHGMEYPSVPTNVVKKIAGTFSRQHGGNGKLNKDAVSALTEASDWFFERMSADLATYSSHAKRKRIEEADVVTLMKRQRLLNDTHTVFSLAQRYLPGELLQAVRMAPPVMKSRGKKRRLSVVEEE